MLILAVLLAVVCGVLLVLWRRAEADARRYAAAARDANKRSREQELLIRHQCELVDGYRAELDALSIAPPAAVDTRTGSHDALPINDHNRQMLTAYCEGMWQHQPTATEES